MLLIFNGSRVFLDHSVACLSVFLSEERPSEKYIMNMKFISTILGARKNIVIKIKAKTKNPFSW